MNREEFEQLVTTYKNTNVEMHNLLTTMAKQLQYLKNNADPEMIRRYLSSWVDRVLVHVEKRYTLQPEDLSNKKRVEIPLRIPPNGAYIQDIVPYDDLVEYFRTSNMLKMFSASSKTYLVMFLTEDEYKEILPTEEEEPYTFICGVHIHHR